MGGILDRHLQKPEFCNRYGRRRGGEESERKVKNLLKKLDELLDIKAHQFSLMANCNTAFFCPIISKEEKDHLI